MKHSFPALQIFLAPVAGVILLCSFVVAPFAQVAERIKVDAKINGKPTRLIFDTGASHFILFRPTADRLGLKITNAPLLSRASGGTVPAGITEQCRLELWNKVIDTQFRVVEMSQGIRADMEGVLGWLPLQSNVFVFDGARENVRITKDVPPEALTWTKLSLSTNSLGLEIDLPEPDVGRRIIVDTGMQGGILLNSARWDRWYTSRSNQPTTMNALFNFHDGVVVKPEGWADEVLLGPIRVNDVPVSEASPLFNAISGFEAVVGIYALRRLDLVVDGPNKVAYIRTAETRPLVYPHNRLGAVFVPQDRESDPLFAHVSKGSPAHLAGIRDGDLILKIGNLDVSEWRRNPAVMPLSRFWNSPAGTRLNLTLKRREEEFQLEVVLRDIITPTERRD